MVSQDRLSLPWTTEGKENRRFKAILCTFIVLLLILSVWIPSIILPEKDRKALEKLPPQLAKLVKKKPPPKKKPVPIKIEEPVKKKEVKKKEPKPKAEPKKVKPKKKAIPKLNKPKVVKKPKLSKRVKKAREVAKKSGLLALKSNISDLKNAVNLSTLKNKVSARKEKTIAAKARGINSGDVLRRSAGIKTDHLTAPAETIKLAGREGLSLDATSDEVALALAEEQAALLVHKRNRDNLSLSFEELKKHVIKIYNRALRTDPFLEGVIVLELVIAPSGEVLSCKSVSSELNNPEVLSKIINRVLLHNFGAEDVDQETLRKPFNLHP